MYWLPILLADIGIVSSQDGQVEGQELQGDDTKDALQTVHSLRQLNGLVGILSHLRVVLATKDNGPALMEEESQARLTLVCQSVHFLTFNLCESASRCVEVPLGLLQFNQDLPIWQ